MLHVKFPCIDYNYIQSLWLSFFQDNDSRNKTNSLKPNISCNISYLVQKFVRIKLAKSSRTTPSLSGTALLPHITMARLNSFLPRNICSPSLSACRCSGKQLPGNIFLPGKLLLATFTGIRPFSVCSP